MSKSKFSKTMAPSAEGQLPEQLQSLLKQKKYRQALEVLQKAKRADPSLSVSPSEAEILVLQGQDDLSRSNYRQAEGAFRRAIAQGYYGDSHYWLAKSLLLLNKLDEALKTIKSAFESKQLPKEYSICYLKLLLLKGEREQVEHLIEQQSKRFSAAQLHWVRGVLALQSAPPQDAVVSFQKVKRAVTPGDSPDAWIVYAQQMSGDWDAAANKLGFFPNQPWKMPSRQPKVGRHPVLARLLYWQQVNTVKSRQFIFQQSNPAAQAPLDLLDMLGLIEEGNYHDAAHALLELPPQLSRDPAIAQLRPTLFLLAGQQALTEGQFSCSKLFWQPLLQEQPFNPQLAVNLVQVLSANQEMKAEQRVLTQLIKWIETDAKHHPENWRGDRLNLTLAEAHCKLADTWISLGQKRTALGEVQQAEKLAPTSPEVMGRRGLALAIEDRTTEAVPILTRALEAGCRFSEVYNTLVECLRELGDTTAVNNIRQRFGKSFGDLNAETEVEPWIAALSTLSYPAFARVVRDGDSKNPPMRACQIFVESAEGELTASSGRIALKQEPAVKAWETLLAKLPEAEQIPVLSAIAISILSFAKREKGIAALVNRYMVKVAGLSDRYPEARVAHLTILALKEGTGTSNKLAVPLQAYLAEQPQPGTALAELQLQVRRFGLGLGLRSPIQAALEREPQNPLLLLAMATTYSPYSQPYEQYKQQGFELARRVQDAKALQAFRDEDALIESRDVQEFLPNIDDVDPTDMGAVDRLIESMIRSMLGGKVPKAELERMLPQLKREMMSSMPPGGFNQFEDFDEEDDFDSIFEIKPKKRKRSFRDL